MLRGLDEEGAYAHAARGGNRGHEGRATGIPTIQDKLKSGTKEGNVTKDVTNQCEQEKTYSFTNRTVEPSALMA